jgi:excisionase family DNA binding protein
MKSPPRKTHLTPNEVATLLMVNPVTVRQWAARGLLRAVTTPGGHRRFLLSDVEEFARSRGAVPGGDGTGRPKRVLIVDDDPQAAQYTVELITRHDPDVITEIARDGFDAGSKTESFRPDGLVLDLMMPGMDGFEVCRRLRERKTLHHIRIVALTGHATPDNIDRILKAGADACLPKPPDGRRLLTELGIDPANRARNDPARNEA